MGIFGDKEKKQQKEKEIDEFMLDFALALEVLLGRLPDEKDIVKYANNSHSILYYIQKIHDESEPIISFTGAEHGDLKNLKMNGVIVLTKEKITFAHKDNKSIFTEEVFLNKITAYNIEAHGMGNKEKLHIKQGRKKYEFHSIKVERGGNVFINAFKEAYVNIEKIPIKPKSNNKGSQRMTVYEELEKIHVLKEKGILSEEEFQAEKEKLLNT